MRPSLRYSVLGSLLALTKGSTATEEISLLLSAVEQIGCGADQHYCQSGRQASDPSPLSSRGRNHRSRGRSLEANRIACNGVVAVPVVALGATTGLACSTATTALRLESVSRFRR